MLKVCVDGCKIITVVKGQQDVSHNKVSDEITQDNLKIIKVTCPDSSGNGNEGDTGQGSSHHAEGN